MVARACNPSYSGDWGRRIAWTQEAEVAVSRDRAIVLSSLGNKSVTPSQKKKNKKQKINPNIECLWIEALSSGYSEIYYCLHLTISADLHLYIWKFWSLQHFLVFTSDKNILEKSIAKSLPGS